MQPSQDQLPPTSAVAPVAPPPAVKWYHKPWFVVLMICLFFPVGLILLWMSPVTKMPARIGWTVLIGLGLVIRLAGGSGDSGATPGQSKPDTGTAAAPATGSKQAAAAPASASKAEPQPAPAAPKKAPKWNTSDTNVETNGNIPVAVEALKGMTPADVRAQAQAVVPATVMKSTYKYFGQLLKFTGEVAVAEEYPPGSKIATNIGVKSEVSEIVLTTDDGTIIDFVMLGSSGDVNVGDQATVYGYPVGKGEVANKVGGKFTQVFVVGNSARK